MRDHSSILALFDGLYPILPRLIAQVLAMNSSVVCGSLTNDLLKPCQSCICEFIGLDNLAVRGPMSSDADQFLRPELLNASLMLPRFL
jgi:hypothetical protein